MAARFYLGLFALGLVVTLGVAYFQAAPGYMDADYYYAGGLRLADGHGFSEVVLWNYLDDPRSLPHPSHAYWMPLASILAWAGMLLTGSHNYYSARLCFIIIAACIPPLTAALAWALTSRPATALTAGVLAAFGAFYAPYMATTETFGIYMLLGGLFLLAAGRPRTPASSLALGLTAGLMHLSRADGGLWLFLALGLSLLPIRNPDGAGSGSRFSYLLNVVSVLAAYLLVMGPWFVRNVLVFGTPLAPGGGRLLWLTDYNELFAFPAGRINFAAWRRAGWVPALQARWWALGINLQSLLAVQGAIFQFPFALAGIWQCRPDRRVRTGMLAWVLTFVIMTIAFPFAGARGGFFHSGAALQPLWWALTPIGLETAVAWVAAVRHWAEPRAQTIFRATVVGLTVVLTCVLVAARVVAGWGEEAVLYPRIEQTLVEAGAQAGAPVIVANPPGYFAYTARPALAVPDGDVNTVLAVARQFDARYLVLEHSSLPIGLQDVYTAGPALSSLRYVGEVDGSRIFEIP